MFERVDELEVKSDVQVGLSIKFPKYQLLDLYVETYYATIYVLPGFDNLRSIHAITNVTLYAKLTAPITNFTLGNSLGQQNETQHGNITYFTIEADKSSTLTFDNLISLIYKKKVAKQNLKRLDIMTLQ